MRGHVSITLTDAGVRWPAPAAAPAPKGGPTRPRLARRGPCEFARSPHTERLAPWPAPARSRPTPSGAGDHGRMVEHVQQQLQEALGPAVLVVYWAPLRRGARAPCGAPRRSCGGRLVMVQDVVPKFVCQERCPRSRPPPAEQRVRDGRQRHGARGPSGLGLVVLPGVRHDGRHAVPGARVQHHRAPEPRRGDRGPQGPLRGPQRRGLPLLEREGGDRASPARLVSLS